jgi:hypothetical protein
MSSVEGTLIKPRFQRLLSADQTKIKTRLSNLGWKNKEFDRFSNAFFDEVLKL